MQMTPSLTFVDRGSDPMLANAYPNQLALGTLAPTVQRPSASINRLLEFLQNELPRWRDDGERQAVESERELNAQLCAYLNSAAYHSTWDFIQFRTDVPDESIRGRSIDLGPQPMHTVWIEGRRYTKYELLLPIECKRLPTPTEPQRDEREYVFSRYGLRGGIQRFKYGVHGAAHNLAAMIGYVQQHDCIHWRDQVRTWVTQLTESDHAWTVSEALSEVAHDQNHRFMQLRSVHKRPGTLSSIEIFHYWVEMS